MVDRLHPDRRVDPASDARCCNRRRVAFVGLVAGLLVLHLHACGRVVLEPDAPMPENFAMELERVARQSQFTYFKLEPDGDLHFAGGRKVWTRQATHVTTLDRNQRQAIWRIIASHNLLASRSMPYAKPEAVAYELTVQLKNASRSLRCVDDACPGMKALYDALFKLHADARYAPEMLD